jgi:hypothetical protein
MDIPVPPYILKSRENKAIECICMQIFGMETGRNRKFNVIV